MRIGIVGAYPPLKGPRCSRTFWSARALVEAGHEVCVITDAPDAPPHSFMWIDEVDRGWLATDGLELRYTSIANSKSPAPPSSITLLAAETARAAYLWDFDVLLAFSIEPYGLAAALAARWTETPYILGPTRAEKAFLLGDPAAGEAGRQALRHAAAVMTDSPESMELLGVPEYRITAEAPPPIDPRIFHPHGEALFLGPHIRDLARNWDEVRPDSEPPSDFPLLGLLGDVGHHNSSFDLLEALEILKEAGKPLNVLAAVGGPLARDFVRLAGLHGIVKNVWRIPYLPPWRIPSFLARCSILFCGGSLPGRSAKLTEALACGCHVMATSEVAADHPARLPSECLTVVASSARPAALAEGLSVAVEKASTSASFHNPALAQGANPTATAAYLDTVFRMATENSSRRVPKSHSEPKRDRIKRWLPLHAALYETQAGEIEARLSCDASLSLADGLQDLLACTEDLHQQEESRLRALLSYERLLFWARSDGGKSESEHERPSTVISRRRARTRSVEEFHPHRRAIRVLEADFDVPAAYGESATSTADRPGIESVVSRSAPRLCNVVVLKRSDHVPVVLDVEDAAIAALDRCDGSNSLRDILDGAEVETRASVEQALWSMALEGGLDFK